MASPAPLISRLALELTTAALFAGFGVVMMVGAAEHDIGWGPSGPQAGFFPFRLGLIVTVASLGIMVQAALAWRRLREDAVLDRAQAGRVALFGGPVVAFVIGAQVLGLYLATAIYLLASMRLIGGYRWSVAALAGIGAAAALYVLFERWFGVPLLKGPLEAVLGFV